MSALSGIRNKYQNEYDANERLKKIRKIIASLENKEKKKKTDRAVIAAYKGKSRSLARQIKQEIKEQLKVNPFCPYCGFGMNNNPHCNHIYPVSKGGLSVPKNMVYVCSACNAKKNDLTLAQFVKKYNLDRTGIEKKLEKLGKDY